MKRLWKKIFFTVLFLLFAIFIFGNEHVSVSNYFIQTVGTSPRIFLGLILATSLVIGVFLGIFIERKLILKKSTSPEALIKIEEKETSKEIKSYKTEAELRMLNATKDKFFSIIAHDLKNPFNSLLGFSDLLKNDYDNFNKEEIKRFIQIMHDSSKQGFNLLENLLQWSRSQTGRIAFIPGEVNVRDVVLGCIDLLGSSAKKKQIKIYYDIPENVILNGDIEMLSAVFRNLISNAIKFTPPNGSIKIKTKVLQKFTEISVIDTGVGIPAEKIHDLFRIDKQVSTSGTDNEKGTGLGLILCKEFIDKHKGKIKVSSEPKNGSEFKVILPFQNENKNFNDTDRFRQKAFERN
ncbi:MAG: HAMP domain-containing histidine kinase [Bacteroidales bacterium]|nr:HAMP domain-containing histidine kinase [Bacteroidales bacterium]MCF8403012.1 HAMP domain-containing histidine kinase [Bacteroidales bacterium]